MRLDRYICAATGLTRKQAHQVLRQRRIWVDGESITSPSVHCFEHQVIALDGEQLVIVGSRYFMLHKPIGYVCATQDAMHPTIVDLLDEPNKTQLHSAGRLDLDVTGLVLLTDDGVWSHDVTHPKKQCAKTYYVEVRDPITEQMQHQLEQGVWLHGEDTPTQAAQVVLQTSHCLHLTIHEGRYHQVKRMLAAVGNQVIRLHRHSIGAICLDATLAEGAYRPLTATEIVAVLN